jgi:iron(III) transport system substrate-binding protein
MIRALLATFLFLFAGCAKRDYVVLYTSQDQFYAEPILKKFTEQTGIEVRTVFDTESAKTAALAHRLRAEKNNPQCDVFWSNEEMHTRLLARDGVIAKKDLETAGYRTREIVVNTESVFTPPRSVLDLTNGTWKGRVALAYPLFGTTSSYFLALRQHWGDAKWRAWCEGLVRNEAKIVDGNSVVVRLVGAGECVVGLTDSDDLHAGQRNSLPILPAPQVHESFVIPNTISIISGAPHRDLAQRLVDYLRHPDTLKALVQLGALQGTDPGAIEGDQISIDWSKADLDQMNELLKQIFLRS